MTSPGPPSGGLDSATKDRSGSQAGLARSASTSRATTGPCWGPKAVVMRSATAASSAGADTRISSGSDMGGGQQVRADPEQFGYSLQGPRGVHDHPPIFWVGQPFAKVVEQVGRAFPPDPVGEGQG